MATLLKADAPSKKMFMLRSMTSHTPGACEMVWFITYIIEAFLSRAGQASQVSLKQLQRAWDF